MAANKFISELTELRSQFMRDIRQRMAKVNVHTFAIDICDHYLEMSVEGVDEEDCKIVATQKVESKRVGEIYQASLKTSQIEYQH